MLDRSQIRRAGHNGSDPYSIRFAIEFIASSLRRSGTSRPGGNVPPV